MKHIVKKIGLGLSAAVIATSAQAVDLTKFYAGASYLAEVDHDDRIKQLPGNNAAWTGDQKDQGYGLFLGYQINKNFGVELSYKDLGESTNNMVYNDGNTIIGSTERQHGSLNIVASMDVANNVKVFGKLGYGATYAKVTGVDNLATGSLPDRIGESESKEGANYGVGVQYNINKFFVRAEYEMLPKVGSDQSVASSVSGTPVSEPEVYSISIGTSF
jgi:opacity protein-like surface antigen